MRLPNCVERRAEDQGVRFSLSPTGQSCSLPQLRELKWRGNELFCLQNHSFSSSTSYSGASHSAFNTWGSGRCWPFISRWIEGLLSPVTSIDEPTVEWMLDMFEMKRESMSTCHGRTWWLSSETRTMWRSTHYSDNRSSGTQTSD